MQADLQKRVNAHATTIGVWLSGSLTRQQGESDKEFAERVGVAAARHAMSESNLPLLKKLVNVGDLDFPLEKDDPSKRGFQPK
jgi:hypothetical protein